MGSSTSCGADKTKELVVNYMSGCFFTAMCALLIGLRGMGGFDGGQGTEEAELLKKHLDTLVDNMDGKQPRKTKVQHTLTNTYLSY